MTFLARMRAWLWQRLRLSPKPEAELPRRNAPPKTTVVNREQEGAFFYLRDVLDRLDQCHKLLKQLRRADADAYQYHRQVGAKVVPSASAIPGERLWEHFLDTRPANGMALLFSGDKGDDAWWPSLLYFRKLERAANVQAHRGDLYECLDLFFYKKNAYGVTFYVALDENGRHMILRERSTRTQRLPGRNGGVIHHHGFGYPETLQWWFNNREGPAKAVQTIDEYAWRRFCIVANFCSLPAGDELLVRCTKRNVTASLNVSTKRTPYFFKDRETDAASDGRRKRVFHIVAPHERQLPDGRLVPVKGHYRGQRHFLWNGYQIAIARPSEQFIEAHGVAGSTYTTDEELPADTMNAEELGRRIAERLS